MSQVALVVGASSGFGKEIAIQLLKQGWIVYAAARRLQPMQDIEQRGAKLLSMDVCSDDSVEWGVAQVIAEHGQIDAVLNNAGYGAYGAVEQVPLDKVIHQFEVNLFGMARVNNAVLPHMRRQGHGRIIMTASLASYISTPGSGWYAASKHAIKAMAEALRMEVNEQGIDVIQIEPGPVKTGFEDVAFAQFEQMKNHPVYGDVMYSFQRYMHESYESAPSAEGTIKAMLHAATSKRPKALYRTTLEARVIAPLRMWLGRGIVEFIVRRLFTRYRAQAPTRRER